MVFWAGELKKALSITDKAYDNFVDGHRHPCLYRFDILAKNFSYAKDTRRRHVVSFNYELKEF